MTAVEPAVGRAGHARDDRDARVDVTGRGRPGRGQAWWLPVRLALREMRTGLSGFYVFLACIALGVAVIAAVSALADGLTAGLARQGQVLLGGDGRLSRIHQRASAAELQWIAKQGVTSESATLRSIARVPGRDKQSLVSLKAVDGRYPLFGKAELRDGADLQALIGRDAGVVVDPLFLARVDLKVGDKIRIGEMTFPISGVVEREPDRLVSRVTAGPRVFLSLAQLERTKLVKPGTLVRWHYAVRMDGAATGRRVNGDVTGPGVGAGEVQNFKRRSRRHYRIQGSLCATGVILHRK